jgi:hypothetical protein
MYSAARRPPACKSLKSSNLRGQTSIQFRNKKTPSER